MSVAISILGGAINLAVQIQSDSEWRELFPEIGIDEFCAKLKDFLSSHIPTALEHSVDFSLDASMNRVQGNSRAEPDSANASLLSGDESKDENRTPAEIQADIKKNIRELAKLEQQLLKKNAPAEKAKLKLQAKQLERSILADRLFLNAASSGELRNDVITLKREVGDVKKRQDSVEERVDVVEQHAVSNTDEIVLLKERLAKVEADNKILREEQEATKKSVNDVKDEHDATRRSLHGVRGEQVHIRKVVDSVDNKQRIQNIMLHGIQSDDIDGSLTRIFPSELYDAIDIAYPMLQQQRNPKGGDNNRNDNNEGSGVTVCVRFKTVSACEKARELLRSDDFKDKHPLLRNTNDTSEMSRVGGSRIRAVEEKLKQQFDGIEVKKDYVRLGGQRLSAADFVSSHIIIADEPFNVDKTVRENDNFEINHKSKTHHDGRMVYGVRLKRGKGAGGARGQGRRPGPSRRDDNPSRATVFEANRGGRAARGGKHGGVGGNLVASVPPTYGPTSGGVFVMSHGNASHGGGAVRKLVMNVS
jgi:hypothetical protein